MMNNIVMRSVSIRPLMKELRASSWKSSMMSLRASYTKNTISLLISIVK
jgi:hypothetical protein